MLQLAEELKDRGLIMEAHRSIGAVLVMLGRCSEALEHLEKGIALCACDITISAIGFSLASIAK